ncbi:MAG: prepilin-type N-terminal cleavage/methylation domain-containing protein [Candidatus Paceibacterota bacterium]
MSMIKTSSKSGFTLVEVLAVIFVITVGVTGVYSLMQTTMTSSNLVSNKLTATYLAQEGVELVRYVRDSNWLEMRGDPDSTISWDQGFPSESVDEQNYEIDYQELGKDDPDLTPCNGVCRYLEVNDQGYYGYNIGKDTRYKRKIALKNDGDKIKVKVKVIFNHQGKEYSIKVEENMYKWRGQ